MAKQLLIDAYRGKMTPSPPWVPYSGVHSAFLIDQPAEKFLQDPEIMARELNVSPQDVTFKGSGSSLER